MSGFVCYAQEVSFSVFALNKVSQIFGYKSVLIYPNGKYVVSEILRKAKIDREEWFSVG